MKITWLLDASIRRFWWNPKAKSSPYWTPMSWSLCVGPKRREAWVSETSGTSTKLSSPNLAGGLFQERIASMFKCSKQNTRFEIIGFPSPFWVKLLLFGKV